MELRSYFYRISTARVDENKFTEIISRCTVAYFATELLTQNIARVCFRVQKLTRFNRVDGQRRQRRNVEKRLYKSNLHRQAAFPVAFTVNKSKFNINIFTCTKCARIYIYISSDVSLHSRIKFQKNMSRTDKWQDILHERVQENISNYCT